MQSALIYEKSQIYNRLSGNLEDVTVELIDSHLVNRAQKEWDVYHKSLKKTDENLKESEHSHWNWFKKLRWAEQSSIRPKTLAVTSSKGDCEGLMMFQPLDSGGNGADWPIYDLLEVKYLQTAPWNELRIKRPVHYPQKYSLVGSVLLNYAILQSVEWGYKGRVGLESLDQARSWYEKQGFELVKPAKTEKELDWFELSEKEAERLLSNG